MRPWFYTLGLSVGISITSLPTLTEATYAITGITGGVNPDTGERPFRLDLKDFQASGPAFDLYIQALTQFQAADQGELLSWYEISGIHGMPYRSWDDVDGPYVTGYCTHGSPVFPGWHRGYLALFEGQVYNYAQTIASTYPDDNRDTYLSAATTLRVPYWDWGADPSMPDSLVTRQITITAPDGQQTIDNPLYTYKFHPLPLGSDIPVDDPLAKYTQTVRSPGDDGQSRMDNVQSIMQSNGAWLRSSTYQLLTTETNYTVFCNAALTDRGKDYNNLESIHDAVHAYVGDNGHMTYFSLAAMDPIFWLHHSAIDRIFALWQVINPNSYVEPLPDEYGTLVVEAGTVEDVDSPLYPFHSTSDPNSFWTSASLRSTSTFGYTYPEIVDWGVDQATLQNNVRAAINNLYNPPAAREKAVKERALPDVDNVKELAETAPAAVTGKLSPEDFAAMGVNNLKRHWAINVRVDKLALEGTPFQIHFFYGNPPFDLSPKEYGHAANLIGTYRTFTSPHSPSSSSSSSLPGSKKASHGQISLSPTLANAISHGIIDDNLNSEQVVPQLIRNLNWRVTDASGNEIDTQDLVDRGDLRIGVVARDVTPLDDLNEQDGSGTSRGISRLAFPRYGRWVEYADVTGGKVGGIQD